MTNYVALQKQLNKNFVKKLGGKKLGGKSPGSFSERGAFVVIRKVKSKQKGDMVRQRLQWGHSYFVNQSSTINIAVGCK